MSSNRSNVKGEAGNQRVLYPPDNKSKSNPAKETLRFEEHLVWLENQIQMKYGAYSVLIEGTPLPELVHPVWQRPGQSSQPRTTRRSNQSSAREDAKDEQDEEAPDQTGMTLEIYNNRYNAIDREIAERNKTLPLVVGYVISTFSTEFLTYINNNETVKRQ